MIIRRYDEPGTKPHDAVTFKSRLYEVGAKVLFVDYRSQAEHIAVVHCG